MGPQESDDATASNSEDATTSGTKGARATITEDVAEGAT